jgi:hypothetical protein
MDSAVITLAKTLCQFETKDLNDVFTNAETPALLMLSKYISIPKLSEYINSQTINYTSAEVGTESYYTLLHIDYVDSIRDGDMINIPTSDLSPKVYSGNYVVENLDKDNLTIEIRKTFTVTESGIITNKSNDNIQMAHAYFILYFVSQSTQNIVINDVIYSSQQFGQGTIAPASQSEKKMFCERYKLQALSYLSLTISGMVI